MLQRWRRVYQILPRCAWREESDMRKLQGLVIATPTPMHEDGSLDLRSLDAHVRDLLTNRAEGLFVAGTTGEGLLLDEEERLEVVRAAVRLVAGRVPVVVSAAVSPRPGRRGWRHACTTRGRMGLPR